MPLSIQAEVPEWQRPIVLSSIKFALFSGLSLLDQVYFV
jgi:hypothetical protein